MKRKWDLMTEEQHRKCIDEIITRIEEIEDAKVGTIAAQDIIDIVVENLAPLIYNKGIHDAKKIVSERFQDIDIDLDTLEQRV